MLKYLISLSCKALIITVAAVFIAAAVNAARPNSLAWNWRPEPPKARLFDDLTELDKYLAEADTVLVDTRAGLFYKMSHIPQAVSLPLDKAETMLPPFIESLPSQARIIIYCSDALCNMAANLAEKMVAQGLEPLIFSPGFEAWEAAGRPLETGDGLK